MMRLGPAVLFLLISLLVSGSARAQEKNHDALPPGAVRAFGTSENAHEKRVSSISFSSDGRWVASSGVDLKICVWEVSGGHLVHEISVPYALYAMSLSPTEQRLAFGQAASIHMVDTSSWDPIGEPTEVEEIIKSMDFSSDGEKMVIGNSKGVVRIIDIKKQRIQFALDDHGNWESADSVAFSPGDRYVVSGSEDSTVKLWSTKNGRLVKTYDDHTDDVNSVSITPDGRFIVSGSSDSTMNFWEVSTGQLVQTFPGHKYTVDTVGVSPSGLIIASGGSEGIVKLCGADSGRVIHTFRTGAGVWRMEFAPSGLSFVTGHDDGSLVQWSLDPRTWNVHLPIQEARKAGHERLFKKLADGHVIAFHQALFELIDRGEAIIPFLEKKLTRILTWSKKEKKIFINKIKEHLPKLRNPDYDVRQKAQKHIINLVSGAGYNALKEIQRTIKNVNHPEIKLRLKRIVRIYQKAPLQGDRLRLFRCVQILEQIGSKKARHLVKQIASKRNETWVGRFAASALFRMKADEEDRK